MASSSFSKPSEMETPTHPNWVELPRDVTMKILHRLGPFDILLNAQRVCPTWRHISKDPLMWRVIDLTYRITPHKVQLNFTNLSRHAIGRSSGHLQDITIGYSASDDLLIYIAYRPNHLRRLKIEDCCGITSGGLIKAANKFPLLEEIDISYLGEDTLEAFGKSCPLLKVLKYNRRPVKGIGCDKEAFAIAKNMPQLRCLQLGGNMLTNAGLEAILDGCPHLESLDLKTCFNVDLKASLGKRCAEQIRDLCLPDHSLAIVETTDEDDFYAYRDMYMCCDW